jgi:hypothetical protein
MKITQQSRDVAARIRRGGATAGQCPGMCTPQCFGSTVHSDHSVDADASTRCKYGASAELMKNVALDRTTFLQLDADRTDSALHAAAYDDVLRNDAVLDLCAIADQKIGGAQLAFDSGWTIAFDVADDRHSGSGLAQTSSYGCTILRMTSVAFADAFLSFSGALLFMLFNVSPFFFFAAMRVRYATDSYRSGRF